MPLNVSMIFRHKKLSLLGGGGLKVGANAYTIYYDIV